ncbi:MAG: DUF2867 domain-containing protein [Pseudomonadota bacterium]
MFAPKVISCRLPRDSRLWDRVSGSHFLDCYSVHSDMGARAAGEVIVGFPGWVRMLLSMRRVLTTPLGLSNDGPPAEDKLGPFPVEMETDTEVIAGFDDWHLEFRVAVLSRDNRVYLATWVAPHNLFGRAYLRAIMPFHILVARDALRRVAAGRSSGTVAAA